MSENNPTGSLKYSRLRKNEAVFEMDRIRLLLDDGSYAEIDRDFEDLADITWHTAKNARGRVTAVRSGRNVTLHSAVIGPIPSGMMIDHINGDVRDNRRSNLRVVTPSQNFRNAHNIRGKSRFKGVDNHRGKWRARIYDGKKQITLGRFDTEEKAARAYDCAAIAHYGEFAATNEKLGLL